MSPPDAVAMVTDAYDLTTDMETWVVRAVGTFRTHLDDGLGLLGGTFSRSPAAVQHFQLDGAHPLNRALLEEALARRLLDVLPDGSAIAEAQQVFGAELYRSLLARLSEEVPTRGHAGIHCDDGAGASFFVSVPRRSEVHPVTTAWQLMRRIAPHFAAAMRLRRSITGPAFDTESAEAIFSPDGRCLHAQGMAQARSARDLLRAAVRQRRAWRESAQARSALPEALLAGRWSLVDRFDSDGGRFLVAYRNPRGVLDPRRLSTRERDVVLRIARGMSQKAVAAELGIRAVTVASVSWGAVRKLGVRSTRELPLFWRDASGVPFALGAAGLLALGSHPAPADSPSLTTAERDVLARIVSGQTNEQIATTRQTSVRTVANQVATLLRKLGARSRIDLAARALADGSPPGSGSR